MRIGIDCRSLQEPQPTGVSVYTRQLLQTMLALPEAAKHEFVGFVSGREMQNADRLAHATHGLDFPNITWKVHPWPNKLLTASVLARQLPSTRELFGEVDVVFVPNMQFFPFQDSEIPYVLTVHDLSFERVPDCLDTKGKLRHRLLQTREFMRQARYCLAVSSHTKFDMVEQYDMNPANISVVYPGVPEARDSNVRVALRHLHDGRVLPYVLCVATVEPRKNIDTLIAAFQKIEQQHPELQLVVIGAPGWKSKTVIAQMEAHPRIHYAGYIDDQKKQALLHSAKAFVYPSVYEGFGFPPLEAQAAGVPVIVGQHSSLPEVLGNGAVYANVLDVGSLADAMHTILTEPELRSHIVAVGAENVTRFSWEYAAKKTLAALQVAAI